MIQLYEREGCPFCKKVRSALELRGLHYEAIPVPKLGSERAEVLALDGVSGASVPVLVDGDVVLQDTQKILAYLQEKAPAAWFGDPSYGLTRRLKGASFDDVVAATRAGLATEGFGVLTEIDVKATMKKKIDKDLPNYIILGACNPPLAFEAISAEPAVGLLLPCNVMVAEEPDGTIVVSTIDPRPMFALVDNAAVAKVADEVGAKLRRALAAIRL